MNNDPKLTIFNRATFSFLMFLRSEKYMSCYTVYVIWTTWCLLVVLYLKKNCCVLFMSEGGTSSFLNACVPADGTLQDKRSFFGHVGVVCSVQKNILSTSTNDSL